MIQPGRLADDSDSAVTVTDSDKHTDSDTVTGAAAHIEPLGWPEESSHRNRDDLTVTAGPA